MTDDKTAIEQTFSNFPISKVPNFSFPPKSEDAARLTQAISSISPAQLNEYRSASAFMYAIAAEAQMWKKQLPENFRPAILAILLTWQ